MMKSYHLKKMQLLFLLLMASALSVVNAQSVTNYTFSASAGTYVPLAGGTTPTLSGGDADDGWYNNLPIGFTFTYMGVPYTTFSASTNGFITLGQTLTTSVAANSPTAGTPRPIIAPLWDDLDLAAGAFSYATTGAPGNRVLTVEWLNQQWNWQATAAGISYQAILYEADGRIEFVYRQEAGPINAGSASIAITATGTGAGNYLSLNNATTAPTASSTTSTTNIAAKPATGQVYTFTPRTAPATPITFTASAITPSTMNVSWVDNSTTEYGFSVYRSTDNTNFTYIGTVASTTPAGTGTTYSQTQDFLAPNTLYYYRIVANSEAFASGDLTGSATTTVPSFCGNWTVGPTGNYPSLTAAIADIAMQGLACTSLLELQSTYVSTVETFPITIPSLSNDPATTTLTIRPEAGATNLTISHDTLLTFIFNSAAGVVIDGRPGGMGTTSQLTVQNNGVAANEGIAFRFQNSSTYNVLRYLTIRGGNTSATAGVITFGTSTAATGNSFNVIEDNNIRESAGMPINLIYSAGSAGAVNTGNSVTNNNLSNFFHATTSTAAVYVAANNSAWTISANRVFQTANRTYTNTTTTPHYGIRIGSTIGVNFIVNNNTIGYANAAGTGTYTMDGTGLTRFQAIFLDAGTATASEIQGNLITNIALTTAATSTTATTGAILSGITVAGGRVNIGTVTPNTVGSILNNDAITMTASATGGHAVGIYATSASTVVIKNNIIGGITVTNSGTGSNTLKGIFTTGSLGNITIESNTIGSPTLANSLRVGVAGTTTNATTVYGIENDNSGVVLIASNQVTNLSGFGTGTGSVRGINNTDAVTTISGNTISFLTSASSSTTTTTAGLIGIAQASSDSDQVVHNNLIHSLTNTAATANVSVNGIYYSAGTLGQNFITRNTIRDLAVVSTGAPVINGAYFNNGAFTFANNMISLGRNAAGAELTAGNITISGVRDNVGSATAVDNFFHNSVHIFGSNVTSGTANTYGYIRLLTSITNLNNNIFANTRANSTGTGKHYAVSLNATTTVTSNNNAYYFSNGLMGVIAGTDRATLVAWKAATSQDSNSSATNPNFISATDLHISNSLPSSLESKGTVTSVTTDYDNEVRPGPAGSVNGGGTAPDIGADEFDGIPVTLDMGAAALLNPSTTGCYTASETLRIRIKNYAGQAIDFAINPVTLQAEVTGTNAMIFPQLDITSGTLGAGQTLDTTIATGYNMSALGLYTFKAYTVLAGDGDAANDSMLAVPVNISAGTASAASTTICNGTSTSLTLTGFNGTIQWQSSPDGATWTNETGTGSTASMYPVSPTADTTYFRALVCGVHASNVDTVIVVTIDAPVTTGDTRCGNGPVSLSATGTGMLNWYANATGGPVLTSGTNYSPTVTNTTNYYVSNFVFTGAQNQVGPTSNTMGTGGNSTVNWELIFDVYVPTTLYGVHVYPGAAGNVVINLTNSAGTVLNTATVAVTAANVGQKTYIPLNFPLAAGTDFTLERGTGSVSMYRNSAGATYPYTLPGILSITNNGFDPDYYYYFYDWRVAGGCESARTIVTATVNPAPAITATLSSAVICAGDSTTLSVTSTNAYSYEWSASAGLSDTTGATVMASPAVTTTYTVSATDTAGCFVSDSLTITVNQLPVSPALIGDTICAGDTLQLNTQPSAGSSLTYCIPTYSSGTDDGDYVGHVSLGNINNTTLGAATPFYTFYSNMSTDLMPGQSYWIKFGPGTYNGSNNMAAWIDFNADGVFDPAEKLGQKNSMSAAPAIDSVNFTVPVTAVAGPTRLRVREVFSSTTFTACSNHGYGETEDYVVNISSPYLYAWSPSASISDSSAKSPIASPSTTTTYTVAITDTITGCVKIDSVTIMVNPKPVVNLGNDTNICAGAQLMLNAGSGYTSYMWSTAETSDTIYVTAAGSYSVQVVDTNGCTNVDTINVTVSPLPVVTLGNDTTICSNEPITIDAGTGFVSYSWSSGETTNTIVVNTTGQYSVMVTDTNGCAGSDTMQVNVNPAPVADLGADQSFCIGSSTTLDAGAGFTAYMWSDNSTGQTITVSSTGMYTVEITDANGCSDSDSIQVTVHNPVVDLGATQSICSGAPAVLDAGAGFASYLWSDNSTGQTLTATSAGTYYVTVVDTNGCTTSDTVTVNEFTAPSVELGQDFTVCSSQPVTLDAGTGFVSYQWSNAETTQSIAVTASGSYSVTVTDANGCTATDAINVTIEQEHLFDLGSDIEVCAGTNVTLDAAPGAASYLWSDGSTGQTLNVTASGSYTVTATTANGCVTSDSIVVVINNPMVDLGTQSICNGSPAVLDAGAGFASYQWSDNSTGQTITVTTAGQYHVTVTDTNGCTASDTINVNANPLPVVSLGGDVTICSDASAMLDAGAGFASYQWSNSSSTQTITVTTSGAYSVLVTDTNGCQNSDTVNVTVNTVPSVNLGADTAVCVNGAIVLDAGAGFTNYLWNTGSEAQTIQVTGSALTPGTYNYSVVVTGANGCSNTDTVAVEVKSCIGIEESAAYSFRITPNPSEGIFTITSTASIGGDVMIEIVDLDGRVVFSAAEQGLTSKTINLDVANGMYFMRVQAAGKTTIQKIVIQ